MIVFTEKEKVVSLFLLKIFNQSASLYISSKKQGFFEEFLVSGLDTTRNQKPNGYQSMIDIHSNTNRR